MLTKSFIDDHRKIRSLNSRYSGPVTLRNLREIIDHFNEFIEVARDLILDYAAWLDETGKCKQDEICRKIKYELRDKIAQSKISERWIEDCLPREYKRKYIKSEVNLVSRNPNLLAIVDTQEEINSEGKPVYNHQQAIAIAENGSSPFKDDCKTNPPELGEVREKQILRDQMNRVSYECYCMLDMIGVVEKESRESLLLAYRNLLKRSIDAVNHKIALLQGA